MSRFIQRSVERLELGDGDWVDLRIRLSYGDRAAIEEKLIGPAIFASDISDGKGNAPQVPPGSVEIGLAASNLELLKRTVVAWGGPGFTLEGGALAPINEETLNSLDETGEKILNELKRRLVKPRPGFTQPPSPPTPTAGAAESTDAA